MADIPDHKDFKLLRYFTATSLVAFLIVAALLGYIFRTLSINAMIASCESEHTNLAKVLANEIVNHELELLLKATEVKHDSGQKGQPPHITAMNEEVTSVLKGTSIFKVKLYNLKGITTYSTELKQIGEDKSKNAGVVAGLQGRTSSKLTHRNTFSAFEGEIQNIDLVESYVPLYDSATGKISGVFEIYGDATQRVAQISNRQWYIVGAILGLLSMLYLTLSVIVKRAQNRIIRQDEESRRYLQALSESEERWEFALEGSGDGVWDRNLQTGEVLYSKRYKEIYGFSENELVDHQESWYARVHPDDLHQVNADREAYFAGQQQSYTSERRMQCKDGSWKWVLSRGMVVSRDPEGKPLRMIGTHSDITERHQREDKLRLAATVLNTMDEAVVVTDLENRIVSVNPAFTRITGYLPDEVIGKDPKVLASATQSAEFYQEMWQSLFATDAWQGEIRNRRKDGNLYLEWLSLKRVYNDLGLPTNYVAVFSDITERKATEERTQYLAHYDLLTGLPNRTLFSDRLQQAIAKARRDKSQMALMFIDLDKFKPVNDTLGHQVGDLLLEQVACRLRECLRRESDTVGRVGGDEFVVILQEIETVGDARLVAEKILQSLNQSFDIAGHPINISSSIGIAIFPEHGSDEKLLLKSADAAMYRAKEAGRNRLVMAELLSP